MNNFEHKKSIFDYTALKYNGMSIYINSISFFIISIIKIL